MWFVFTGLQDLEVEALKNSKGAYRPGTKENHCTMFNSYLNFCNKFRVRPLNPDLSTVLAYLQSLNQKLKSPKSLNNYWSAVKLLHQLMRVPLDKEQDIQVQLFLRAIPLNKRHVSQQKKPITRSHLTQMCQLLDRQGKVGLVIKTAILFGYFAFLRASNLCPEKADKFDNTRHFCRSDVQILDTGLKIKLKWAKNMQHSLQPLTVPIIAVPGEIIDPLQAYKNMIKEIPCHHNQPLFMLNNHEPLVVSKLRSIFSLLCKKIGIDETKYSIHSLRRGGATHSYEKGANLLDIQRHGAWSSLAFHDYIAPEPDHTTSVCSALAF